MYILTIRCSGRSFFLLKMTMQYFISLHSLVTMSHIDGIDYIFHKIWAGVCIAFVMLCSL